ncbi:MAG: chloride channel protein, partial [Proteobacteria bacterium]|nr:chloride channel protein [Pseudomonadota bacterium]
GGFLAPSLSLGAAIGSWFSVITDYSNHNLLVLVGMSAFLSAVVRAPFTAWVIVMEMTDRRTAIFPLMVASVVSYATSRFLQQKMGSKN